MKIRQLVSYWDNHARGRLTQDTHTVALATQNEKILDELSRRYPMKDREALLRDLISASLDELETSFPYVQGSRVVALDEEGFEIYEDTGLTPRFVRLSQEKMKQLKSTNS